MTIVTESFHLPDCTMICLVCIPFCQKLTHPQLSAYPWTRVENKLIGKDTAMVWYGMVWYDMI